MYDILQILLCFFFSLNEMSIGPVCEKITKPRMQATLTGQSSRSVDNYSTTYCRTHFSPLRKLLFWRSSFAWTQQATAVSWISFSPSSCLPETEELSSFTVLSIVQISTWTQQPVVQEISIPEKCECVQGWKCWWKASTQSCRSHLIILASLPCYSRLLFRIL